MKIGKVEIRCTWINLWYSAKDTLEAFAGFFYFYARFSGGHTLMTIGPLVFTWNAEKDSIPSTNP